MAGPQPPTGPAAVRFPCDSCRQGDTLRVRSLSALGLGQFAETGDLSHLVQQDANAVEDTQLFQGGTELQPQQDPYGLAYYQLPAGSATYRLTDTYHNGTVAQRIAKTVSTTWTFQSGRPQAGNLDPSHACIDALLYGDTDPCAWQPLIYLSYQLGLGADDSVPAGRPYSFTITARDGRPDATTRLAGLRLWLSPDGGTHWTRAQVVPGPGGTYRVSTRNPQLAGTTSGTVSIKVEAWDKTGNSVEQTIKDAYALR
jgi:hypothetical protein